MGWALGLRGVSQCELVMAARLTEHRATADVAREPVGVMGFMTIPRSRRRSSGTANADNRIEFRFHPPLLYSIRCSTCRVRRLSRRHSCRPDARTCEDQTSEISYVFTGISILAVPVGTSYTPNVFRVGRISNQRWIADHDGVSLARVRGEPPVSVACDMPRQDTLGICENMIRLLGEENGEACHAPRPRTTAQHRLADTLLYHPANECLQAAG